MKRPGWNRASVGLRSPGFFSYILITMAAQVVLAQAQEVRALDVSGNTAFSTRELLKEFRTKPGKPFDASLFKEDLHGLKDRYLRAGYLSCSTSETRMVVDTSRSFEDILVVVREGRQVLIGSVAIAESLTVEPVPLLEFLDARIGDPFNQTELEEGIARMLASLDRQGHPLARISIRSVSLDTASSVDSVNILISVKEGPEVAITQVTIEGNKTTNDDVIMREVRLQERPRYSDERIKNIRRRLERLQLFSSVSVPEFFVTPEGKGGVIIRVQEGQQNRFDGVLGYVPSGPGGEPGYVTGLIDLEFRSLFGTGRRLSTHWARENETTQDLAVRYREPWVASWPVNAEIEFGQRKQDSTYLRRNYDGSAELMLNDELTIGLVLGHTTVYPSERPQNPVAASSNTTIGGTIRFDSRSDPLTAESGVLYSTTIELGRKSVKSGPVMGTSQTRRLTFDLEYYLSFVRRQVLATFVHGRDFESPSLDRSDLFRLGGTSTLRGYRESQFLGSSMAWINAEYRFLLGGRSYAYGFFDVGYASLPDRPASGLVKSEWTRMGYGVGTRLDTKIGLIGISLGFGEGDTFRTAKLHIRLINEF